MGNVERRNNFMLQRLKVEYSIENFVDKKLQIEVLNRKRHNELNRKIN